MNMKILAVVTPLYIYNCFSTQNMLWEENFTLGEFTAVNMKKFGHRNVRKHIYSNDSEKYINLDILLKYDSLYKTGITSS